MLKPIHVVHYRNAHYKLSSDNMCQKIKKYFLTQKYKKVANYSQKMKEMNDHQTNLTKSKKKIKLLHELLISFFR